MERGLHAKRLKEVEEALRRLGLKPRTREVARWREERTPREALGPSRSGSTPSPKASPSPSTPG